MKKDIAEIKWTDGNGAEKTAFMDRDAFEYYPADMDKDMIPLCDAFNGLPGVRTFYCCSGHGRDTNEFYLMLGIRNMKSLKRILSALDSYGDPTVGGCYDIEPDGSFWALKKSEIGIRLSNKWVSGLKFAARRREFARIAKKLTGNVSETEKKNEDDNRGKTGKMR